MNHLFSYGTLQLKQVQIDIFGQELEGQPESLSKHVLKEVKITDSDVIKSSGLEIHTIIAYTGDSNDVINGTLFKLTDQQLKQADDYEVDDYARTEIKFDSGLKGFVYGPANN